MPGTMAISQPLGNASRTLSLLYQQRESFSAATTLVMFGVFLIGVAFSPVVKKVTHLAERPIEVSLSQPEQPAPEPQAAAVPPVQAQAKAPIRATLQPSPVAAAQTAETPATTSPEPAQHVVPPSATKTISTAVATLETTRPAPATPPPAQPSPAQTDRYEAQILRYLESIKRYPSSREARQTRPAGVVTVWFELARSGRVLDAGIERGSNSSLLDSEALKTVRAGNFPQFPEAVFANADKHRFSAHLSYELKTSE